MMAHDDHQTGYLRRLKGGPSGGAEDKRYLYEASALDGELSTRGIGARPSPAGANREG